MSPSKECFAAAGSKTLLYTPKDFIWCVYVLQEQNVHTPKIISRTNALLNRYFVKSLVFYIL